MNLFSIPITLFLVSFLTACGQSEWSKPADVASIEQLSADLARLKEQHQ